MNSGVATCTMSRRAVLLEPGSDLVAMATAAAGTLLY